MGDLAVTAVTIIEEIEGITLPAAEAISSGQLVGIDSNGKACLADADTGPILVQGIAVTAAAVAGQAVHILRKGSVNIGNILTGIAFLGSVYPSATAGTISDSQINGQAACATVQPKWGATTADKCLRFNL